MSDVEQLAYARQEERVIFTEDVDFLIMASKNVSHCGIVYARKGSRSVGQIIEWLQLIHGTMESEEMLNHVEYI